MPCSLTRFQVPRSSSARTFSRNERSGVPQAPSSSSCPSVDLVYGELHRSFIRLRLNSEQSRLRADDDGGMPPPYHAGRPIQQTDFQLETTLHAKDSPTRLLGRQPVWESVSALNAEEIFPCSLHTSQSLESPRRGASHSITTRRNSLEEFRGWGDDVL